MAINRQNNEFFCLLHIISKVVYLRHKFGILFDRLHNSHGATIENLPCDAEVRGVDLLLGCLYLSLKILGSLALSQLLTLLLLTLEVCNLSELRFAKVHIVREEVVLVTISEKNA